MRFIFLLALTLLTGCNALGGVPPNLVDGAMNAAASCIRLDSLVMGKAVVVTANDTKGAIVNGSVKVDPDTCALTITNGPAKP